MKQRGRLQAQPACLRIVLVLLLAPALLARSLPMPVRAAEQAKPSEVWAIRWTATMTASGEYSGNGYSSTKHYTYLNTASLLFRKYPDGDFDNAEFKLHVQDTFDKTESRVCEDENGHSGTAVSNTHVETDDPDKYNGNPAGVYNFGRYRPPESDWQGSLYFEWNPGYSFTGSGREKGQDCSGSFERPVTWPPAGLPSMEWTPLCVEMPTLTGNEQGSEFTYHEQGSDLTTGFGCFGPLFGLADLDAEDQLSWSVDISVRLLEARDLTVERMEVTQGLQDEANTMPLVQGRRTIVRAYIGIGSEPGPVLGVSGELEGHAGGGKLGTIYPINERGSIDAPTDPDWKKIDDTLNFELPEAWTRQPSLHLKVEVNANRRMAESNYENNERSADVSLRDCSGISVGFAPIHYDPPESGPADPSGNIALGQMFAQKVYPVSDSEFDYVPKGAITLMQNVNISPTDISLLQSLEATLLVSSPPRPDHIFGWLPALAYDDNGVAYLGGISGFGNDTETPDRWRRTFAHELGHNYGLDESELTTGGLHWFDVYDLAIKPVPPSVGEDKLLDVMVPGRLEPEAWISPQSYKYLLGKLCGAGAAQTASGLAPQADTLLMSAVLRDTTPASGTLAPLVRLSGVPLHTPPPGIQYCFDLLDASHTLLHSYCFDQDMQGDSPGPLGVGVTSMVVPVPAGLKRVELTEFGSDTVLSARAASAHPPTVVVNTPNAAGLALSGPQTIGWTGGDLDGDPLTYLVLYSRDNGATWTGIAAVLTAPSITVDFAAQPGTNGAAGLIKVMASDGFHTAQDTSDHPFSVGNKAPSAAILSPPTGATFPTGPQVVLYGAGVDLEEGLLGDSALSWASSRDGALGTGRVLETPLSVGTHTVTLTVTDSGALKDTATTQLTVAQATGAPDLELYLPLITR